LTYSYFYTSIFLLYNQTFPILQIIPTATRGESSSFILWRYTTSELWTPVLFPLYCYYLLLYSHCLLYSHTITIFHSICSFLCLQQIGEIDNLIVSWEQSIWLCCVQVPRCSWQSKALDEAPYKLSGAVAS
jgi:hypothetical protein